MEEKKTKRKKSRHVEYDYESFFQNDAGELDEWMIEQMLRTGKIKCIYATKEIYAGNQLEIEIYPEFTREQAKRVGVWQWHPDKAKQKEAQRNLNDKNARKWLRRLIEHNFDNQDLWITLTYSVEPADIEEATRNIKKFIRCINGKRKRRGLPNAKYVYVTEEVSEDGEVVRIHHHMVMDGMLDLDTVIKTWKHGGRNEYRKIEKDDDGIAGAMEYMLKPAAEKRRKKHRKRWAASTNLEQPPEKKHHQTRQKDVQKMAQQHDYIREYVENVKMRSGKKRYAGYIYTRAEVRYNELNGMYYVKIRMRKDPTRNKGVGG